MFHRKQILKNDNDNKHDNTRFDVLPSTSAATPPDIPAEQQQGPTSMY